MLPALLFTKTPPDPGQESASFDGPVTRQATPTPPQGRVQRASRSAAIDGGARQAQD